MGKGRSGGNAAPSRRRKLSEGWTARFLRVMILTLAFMLGLGTGEAWTARAEEQEERLRILFIHNNPCESCHEVDKFAESVREQFGEAGVPFHYDIIGYYAYGTEGAEKVKELKSQFGISDQDMLYPMVVIGDRYLLGSSSVENGVKDLMLEMWEEAHPKEENTETGAKDISASDEGASPESELVGAKSESVAISETKDETRAESADISKTEETAGVTSERISGEILVRYFDTVACESCEKADQAVEELPKSVEIDGETYSVTVEQYSVAEGDNAEKLTALFEQYEVPKDEQRVPILFVGSRYLSGEKEICGETTALLSSREALETVSGEVTQQSENLLDAVGIGGIIATGFLNGLNPCSLSMTLLFLSLLVSRKNFLRYGLAFLTGKYVAYVGLGIAVSRAAAVIPAAAFGVASTVINVILLILCLALAIGNFLDFLNVRKGEYGKVRVQLPVALRRWNHKFIKQTVQEGAGKFLLPAVFIGSAVVSLGEFFCTGQIYLASILRWIEKAGGSGVPVAVFCIYIAMLCVPALIITIMLALGKSALSISDQALKQMPAVKLLNTIFFAVFAALAIKMLIG